MFASSTGPNNRRILPVIPILARQPALLGKDPYHTEQVVAPNKQNYDLLATPAENAPAPAAEVDDEDDLYDSTEATILLPTPAPINMKEPRGSL
jgi:hypothetical protein